MIGACCLDFRKSRKRDFYISTNSEQKVALGNGKGLHTTDQSTALFAERQPAMHTDAGKVLLQKPCGIFI
jgi:hypothetical protein